jgi:proline iminopeptidase
MAELFPDITPSDTIFLDVSEGHRLHVTLAGNPAGRPAILLHGGPGSGLSSTARRYFDPAIFRIIQFDQRGCGQSTPNAADSLEHNTTHHLIDDMEAIRCALAVEDWLVYGSSWGSTLALAYAQRHTKRVRGVVLAGVTTTRQKEIDWLYKGLAMFLPQQWQRFIAAIPDHMPRQDPVGAYHRLLNDPDPAVRATAALEWHLWEASSVSAEGISAFLKNGATAITFLPAPASAPIISTMPPGWTMACFCAMPAASPVFPAYSFRACVICRGRPSPLTNLPQHGREATLSPSMEPAIPRAMRAWKMQSCRQSRDLRIDPLDRLRIRAHCMSHDQRTRTHLLLVLLGLPLRAARQIILSTSRRQAALLFLKRPDGTDKTKGPKK